LIGVKAVGLNGLDAGIASGVLAGMLPHEYPVVLGRDTAGVVTAVGPGVDVVEVGDEVFGHILLAPPIQSGTLAEYALLPVAGIAKKPAGLDFASAAALPLAGAAASAAVDAIDPEPGQTILVVGAAGGVGSYVVQMLSGRGVSVLATGTPADTERLTKLGATQVIDYTETPVTDQIRERYPDGVDGLVDLVSYAADDLPLAAVRRGGRVASSMGAADEQALASAGVTGANIMAMPTGDLIAGLAEQVVTGRLTVDVESILPLEQAADGIATIGAGQARGKIVVRVAA
jgi:NADPH:quinone reductase-like Zn-dependent oxidoreductase